MADTRIVIENKIGQTNNTKNTSVKGTREKTREAFKSNNRGIGQDRKLSGLNKGLNASSSLISNVKRGSSGLSVGKSMGVGVTFAIIQKVIELGSKIVILHYNIQEAKSGDQLYYSNQKQIVNTITSMGMNLVYGKIRNDLITKRVVERQNQSFEYGKNLYNLNNYGEKNKIR